MVLGWGWGGVLKNEVFSTQRWGDGHSRWGNSRSKGMGVAKDEMSLGMGRRQVEGDLEPDHSHVHMRYG